MVEMVIITKTRACSLRERNTSLWAPFTWHKEVVCTEQAAPSYRNKNWTKKKILVVTLMPNLVHCIIAYIEKWLIEWLSWIQRLHESRFKKTGEKKKHLYSIWLDLVAQNSWAFLNINPISKSKWPCCSVSLLYFTHSRCALSAFIFCRQAEISY